MDARESEAGLPVSLSDQDVMTMLVQAMETVRQLPLELWDRPAMGLEWDRRTTLAHIASVLDRYSLALAAQATGRIPYEWVPQPQSDINALLTLIPMRGMVLTTVVAAAAPDTRAYHVFGRPDAAGYLAMTAAEVLLHTQDIVGGTELSWVPPREACAAVVARLFPWAVLGNDDPWAVLRWATGRAALPGRTAIASDWAWHASPLSEWDGEVKRRR